MNSRPRAPSNPATMNDRESIIAHLKAEEAKFREACWAEQAKASSPALIERLGASASLCRTLAACYERRDDRAGQGPEAEADPATLIALCNRHAALARYMHVYLRQIATLLEDRGMNQPPASLDILTPYQAVQSALQAYECWNAQTVREYGAQLVPPEPAPARITAGCLVSWPGSGGEWTALEDAAPDPRGTGRVIFRGRSPDCYGIARQPRRVIELCPPIDCTVRPGSVDWMSRETLLARTRLVPPARDSKLAKAQE